MYNNKRCFIKAVMLCVSILLAINSYAGDKQVLKFNSDRAFKIVQFTDIHWNGEAVDSSVKTDDPYGINYKAMNSILDAEKPDLVVITGDTLFKDGHIEKDLSSALKPVIDHKIPWAYTLGNHDYDHGENPLKVISYLSKLPYSLTEIGYKDSVGAGNYVIQIQSSKNDKAACLLYMLDSHNHSPLLAKDGKSDGWDFIHLDQINWYVSKSTEFTKANGGTPLPALMFFHIPLPEFQQVWNDGKVGGTKLEAVCCPKDNSGLFCAVRMAKDVMGIFVGHDHVNDYIGYLSGIALAYGRKISVTGYGPTPMERGARVILLKEGKREFDTWIRTESGKVENSVNFPDYFQK